jgi:hypothetical protein
MTSYQKVGLRDNIIVQERLWGGRVSPIKWSVALAVFRLYSACAMMWTPRPRWPACLPADSKRSLMRRIYCSLHETSPAKRFLKRFFREVEG